MGPTGETGRFANNRRQKAASNRAAERPFRTTESKSRFPFEFAWLLAACDWMEALHRVDE